MADLARVRYPQRMPEPENTPAPADTQDGRGVRVAKWAFLGVVVAAAITALAPPLVNRLLPPDTDPSTPPPSATAAASPSPVGFQLTSAPAVPQCADLTGHGTKPQGREVGLFVRHVGDDKYFWEKIIEFDGDSWRVENVVIGEPGDAGKEFDLVLVPMSVQAVVEFSKHDGTAYAVDNPPVAPLATIRVTRTTNLTPC